MEDIFPWIFDGIGSELLSMIAGGVLGGGIVYRFNTKHKTTMKQKAKDNATQTIVGRITIEDGQK